MASLPRHLAYNSLPDRYDPTSNTVVDMGDILSSPVSSYNGDGEPCCETSDIKEEACTCTSKWLSQTRLRIIALTDANEALTLDSQQAHARIKELEDQYQGRAYGRGNNNNYQGQYHQTSRQNQPNASGNVNRNSNPAGNIDEQVRAALETTQQVKREAHQAAAAANARIAQLSQQLRATVESSEQLKREAAIANNRLAQMNDTVMRSRNLPLPPAGANPPFPHLQNQLGPQQFPPFDARFPNQEHANNPEFPEFSGFVPPDGGPHMPPFHQHQDPAFQSRVGQLEHSHETLTAQLRDAVRHTGELKEAARRDAINARSQLTALRRTNVAQDVRFAQLSEKHARLLADFAILGNQLDMGLGHANAMRHIPIPAHDNNNMDTRIGGPPHPHMLRGLPTELQEHVARGNEAQMREIHLSRGNAALDLAARAGTHRAEKEFAMRNALEARMAEERARANEEIVRLREENQALGSEVVHRRQREAHPGAEMETRGTNAQLRDVLDATRRQMMVLSEANALKEARLVEANEQANAESNRLAVDNRALTSQYRSARETAAAAIHEARGARARQNEMSNELDVTRRWVMELSDATRARKDHDRMNELANVRLANTESNNRALAAELNNTRNRENTVNNARQAEFAQLNERTNAELHFVRTECENARDREADAIDQVMEARAVQDEMAHELDATRRRVMVLSEANALKNARETRLVEMNERTKQHVSNLETGNRVLSAECMRGREREMMAIDNAQLRDMEQRNILDATRNRVKLLADANALKTMRGNRYIEMGERAKEELANLQTDYRVLTSDVANGRVREAAAVDQAMAAMEKHIQLANLLQNAQQRLFALSEANGNLTRTSVAAQERVAYLENLLQEKERLLREWQADASENSDSEEELYGLDSESDLSQAEWEFQQANERSVRFEEMTREASDELNNLRAAYRALSSECIRRRASENCALEELRELRTRHTETTDLLNATRRRVRALNDANGNLASDSAAAHQRITVLERTLDEKEKVINDWEEQNMDIAQVRQALETAKAAEADATRRCTELQEMNRELSTKSQRLQTELNTANDDNRRAGERVGHLEQSQDSLARQLRAAVMRTDQVKQAAQVATVNAANQLTALRRANSDLDVRHAGLCERYARLLANFAILGNELDIARGHTAAMRHPVNIIAGAPSIAVRTLRAELQLNAAQARESHMRERSLAAANAALDLAARAEAHRAEMELALKNARENQWREVSERAREELAILKADYRVLISENMNAQEREAIARDEAATARATVDSLSKANSELTVEIRASAERVRAAEMEKTIMQSNAQRVGALTSVVARLRARCADLVRRIPEERAHIDAHASTSEAVNIDATEDDVGEVNIDNETICVIDMEVIARGDRALALPCSHVFHRDCIVPYLEAIDTENGETRRCPLDRSVIDMRLDELAEWSWGTDDERDIGYVDSDFSSNVATASTTIESLNGPAVGVGGTEEDESSNNNVDSSNAATAI